MLDIKLASFFSKHKFLEQQTKFAVAVSGGPDSMALACLIIQNIPDKEIHLLTVDHGLRAEAKEEAKMVADWSAGYKNAVHAILEWEGDKPDAAIMEEARAARYKLMVDYCRDHKIETLFVAHHQDDQAETFLIRLAKGSGLDGLASMQALRFYDDSLQLARPLLDVSKEDLISYCDKNNIPYVLDPSNENENYLRPRLRKSMAVLEEEGLSSKRLSLTAKRLARARVALENISDKAHQSCLRNKEDHCAILSYEDLRAYPEEIGLRVVQKTLEEMRPESDYNVRMEKLEELFESLWSAPENFKPRTLGGCIFSLKEKATLLEIKREKE